MKQDVIKQHKRMVGIGLLASGLLAGALLAAGLPAAQAQDGYPARTVRIVVPFAPGGATDVLARAVGERLGKRLGQPFVIENRAGAGTVIASDHVANAAPDGYTLMLAASALATAPLLNSKVNYDPIRSFAPITLVAAVPHILVVPQQSPIRTVKDLIDYARANPGKLSYASVGPGTSNHLEGELFKSMANVFMVHIPYRGSAPALNDVVSGQVDLMFDAIASAGPFVKSGRLRQIALTTARRASVAPDLPTVAESGLPGYEAMPWLGFVAPAGTPAAIVDRLQREVTAIIAEPDMKERLHQWGFEPVGNTPQQFADFIAEESAKWTRVIKDARIRHE